MLTNWCVLIEISNGNKDVKFLEYDYLSCVTLRETHFTPKDAQINFLLKAQNSSLGQNKRICLKKNKVWRNSIYCLEIVFYLTF